jgi:hypothetical protein
LQSWQDRQLIHPDFQTIVLKKESLIPPESISAMSAAAQQQVMHSKAI